MTARSQPRLASNGQPEAGGSGVTAASASAFLEECAKYFEGRPTRGEDQAYWSNTNNAANCRKIVSLLTALANADASEPLPSPREAPKLPSVEDVARIIDQEAFLTNIGGSRLRRASALAKAATILARIRGEGE